MKVMQNPKSKLKEIIKITHKMINKVKEQTRDNPNKQMIGTNQ